MKNIIIGIIILFVIIGYFRTHREVASEIASAPLVVKEVVDQEIKKVNPKDSTILRDGQFGQASATVTRVFGESKEDGVRYQLFNIRLDSGESMLLKHNIDIASKLKNVHTGDKIEFYGIYEQHIKRGVITSTHHDPKHQGADGWIKHAGKTYQ